MNFLLSFLKGLAIILGPLFGSGPRYASPLDEYLFVIDLERYLTLIFAYACWIGFEKAFLTYLSISTDVTGVKNKPKSSRYTTFTHIVSICFTGFFALGTIHLIRVKNPEFIFYLFLLSILGRTIGTIAQKRALYAIAIGGEFVEVALKAMLSFFIFTRRPDWQAMVIAIGYSTMIVAANISQRLKNAKSLSDLPFGKFASQMYTMSLFAGPILWALLVLLHQLPKNYIATLLILIFSYQLPNQFRQVAESIGTNNAALAQKIYVKTLSSIIALYVIVALLLLFS